MDSWASLFPTVAAAATSAAHVSASKVTSVLSCSASDFKFCSWTRWIAVLSSCRLSNAVGSLVDVDCIEGFAVSMS